KLESEGAGPGLLAAVQTALGEVPVVRIPSHAVRPGVVHAYAEDRDIGLLAGEEGPRRDGVEGSNGAAVAAGTRIRGCQAVDGNTPVDVLHRRVAVGRAIPTGHGVEVVADPELAHDSDVRAARVRVVVGVRRVLYVDEAG